jgi:hypothetical protein
VLFISYEGAENEYLIPHHHSENKIETKPLTEAEILLLEKIK